MTVAVGVGTSGGPLVADVLLDVGGYWVAWSSVLFVNAVNVILCLMLERSRDTSGPVHADRAGQDLERPALLSPLHDPEQVSSLAVSETTGMQFYLCVCGHGHVVGVVVSSFCYAVLTASFEITLSLQVCDAFHSRRLPRWVVNCRFPGPRGVL